MTYPIFDAAMRRLSLFDYSPAVPVIYPNQKEGRPPDPDPSMPGGGMWIEAAFFPNEPGDEAWSDDGCVETRGFFRLMVGYRPGSYEKDPGELADALVDWFPKGLDLGPVRVRKRPTRGAAFSEDGGSRLFVPVTVYYLGLT